MASKLIGIVGFTGTGKSTSIKSLDPKETYIFNVAKKELPFKGSEKLYNTENKNYKEINDIREVATGLRVVAEKYPNIKNIVIEDSNYMMSFRMAEKAMENGYTKFNILLKDMVELFKEARSLRNDIKVFYISHPEPIEDDGNIISYKIKTSGKALDNQITLEGLFTICLYTHVEETKSGECNYYFVTNRFNKFPAKSPIGMFDKTMIPNDLSYVCKKVDEYYS